MFRVRTPLINAVQMVAMIVTLGALGFACNPAKAAIRIEGQVQAGGGGIANSSVTLWAASAGEPRNWHKQAQMVTAVSNSPARPTRT